MIRALLPRSADPAGSRSTTTPPGTPDVLVDVDAGHAPDSALKKFSRWVCAIASPGTVCCAFATERAGGFWRARSPRAASR